MSLDRDAALPVNQTVDGVQPSALLPILPFDGHACDNQWSLELSNGG